MQLTIFDGIEGRPRSSSHGKTCPVSSPCQTMPLDALLPDWLGPVPPSFRQGAKGDGQTQVWLLDPAAPLHGGGSTPNISDWPNDAKECLLSQVLEKTSPPKYFLSAKACAGILRRAKNRGKQLPEHLMHALQVGAGLAPTLN